jgi:hypothetical protein
MSGEDSKLMYPALNKKYGTLDGNLGQSPLKEPKYTYSQICKPDFNIEEIKADERAKDEQQQRDLQAYYERHILGDIFGTVMHFEYPVLSIQQVLAKAAKFSVIQLAQEIEITDVEIERRQEAKKIRAATYTREKVEHALWNRTSISIETKSEGRTHHFYVDSIKDAEQLLTLEAEAQQILNVRIAYFAAIKKGYQARLREMEKDAPAILKAKLCEIQQVVKNAEKTIETVRKTAIQNQKSHDVKGRDAVRFSDDRKRFATLQSQYTALHSEIITYTADPTSLSIPVFPNDLLVDDVAYTSEIEQAADRERKGIKNYPIFTT